MRAAVSRIYWIARSSLRASWRARWRPNATALTGDSPEAVEANAAEKMQLLGAIEKLENERRALCAAACQARASRAIGWPRPSPSAGAALMELMAGCRTANEVNGYIIHVRQHQIRQLIDIVRGGPPVTYDPQGKTFAKALRALARGLTYAGTQPPRR